MLRKLSKFLPLGILTLLPQLTWGASSNSLNFFNYWFVTGDYAVAGVGLRGAAVNKGLVTGNINMTGVPSNATPIAAFLYWSTVESSTTPGATNGYFNNYPIQGQVLGNQSANPACGPTSPADFSFTYRADVLRFLPVNSSNVFQANGTQTVKLPASSGTVVYTNGASLVVIYKIVVSGFPLIAPLRVVMINDGAFTMTNKTAPMSQTVEVFQASTNPQARVTGIVANGQSGFSAPWSVNSTTLSTDPFTGAQGAAWDNPSYNISLAPGASSFSTMETANNSTCLTWAAIVASANVQDTDNDGLLDIWETSGLYVNTQVSPPVFGTCVQNGYASPNCVPLNLMGANPNKQDIFIQMDWMYADGTVNGNPAHNHMPPLSSLSSVAATFALHGINVHFDVGNNYQGNACGTAQAPAPCSFIIPTSVTIPAGVIPLTAVRPAPDTASGIDEATLLCPANSTCAYGNLPYPVTSFEFGFDSIRDGNQSIGISAHLSQQRLWAFRYALFGHAIGGPYYANGTPINPTPLSYSGIAQLPGSGFMVTFGLWASDNPAYNMVGTPFEVANTIHHELGHALGLYHGGLSATPNCMPNYPSAMNYLYQIRGLTDANGNEQVDYSYGLLLPLSENLLNTNIPMALPGLQHYEIRYYGPLAPGEPATQAVPLHCDGTAITNGETLVKLQGSTVSTPDWSNGNVALGKLIPPIDLNDEGTSNQLFFDQPDWFVLNLQQIGSAPDFSGISVGAKTSESGAKTSDAGALASESGAKSSDMGAFPNTGVTYSSSAGAVASDSGAKASDNGELDENTVQCSGMPPPTSVTASLGTNNGIGNSVVITLVPPQAGGSLTYNVYRCAGAGCQITQSTPLFKSFAPGQYTITILPVAPFAMVSFTADTVNNTLYGGSTACPGGATCPNTFYVYLVTAQATLQCGTANSTVASSVTDSIPTSAIEVPEQFVVPTSSTVTYDGTQHTVTFQIFGDVSGALTPVQVTCTTERNANAPNTSYQVSGTGGGGQITCSNSTPPTPATEGVIYVASGTSYTDAAGMHTGGTLTINQRPITVTAAASSKTYDATTSSAATPTITTGSLGTGDSVTWTETYQTATVGTGITMIPAGTVNDGNGGNNYAVTFVSTQNGVILTRPVTATLTAQNKTYDTTNTEPNGNMSCSLSNTVDGNVTCSASSGTFNSSQVAQANTVNATATLGGSTATNYTFGASAGTAVNSTPVSAPANIYTLPLTATLTSAPSKTYDGTTTEMNPMTCSVATVLSPDVLTCTATNGNFNTSQVATANKVTATATISGMAVSNYTLGAGGTTASVTSTGVSAASSITTRPVTATLTAQNKPYDGTTTEPSGNMSCSLSNTVDNVVTCTPSNGTFNSSQVAFATTVNATATFGGITAMDYTFGAAGTAQPSIGVMAAASITPVSLVITASSATITYGTSVAIGAAGNGFVNGESLSSLTAQPSCGTAYMPGNPTGNVGNYATSCSGAVDGNYSISYVGGMVMVSPAQLTVTATGVNKSFDGTTNTTVTLSDNRQTGPSFANDTFTDAYTNASFASIGPGMGIAVNVTGISISGPGAANYALTSTTATTTANISDSVNFSLLSLNGVNYTPAWNGSVLQLTNSGSETTSAWLRTAIPVSSAFTTTFQFQITPAATGSNTIGDGFAFVIQSAPSPNGGSPWSGSGNTTLGTTGLGEYIGYVGIPYSIAIEFDTWYNQSEDDPQVAADASDAHIGVQSNGTSPNSANHGTAANLGGPTLNNFADGGQHTARITYDGNSTIKVYVDGSRVVTGTVPSSQTLSQFLGLNGGPAYIGFTAATGGAQEVDLLGSTWTWDFSVIPPPAP